MHDAVVWACGGEQWGPIYNISHDLSHDYLNFIVRSTYGPITIAIRARFEYDSTTIRLQHATTRYEVFRALAYEIVYENQW